MIDYGTSNLRSVAKALEHVAGKDHSVIVSGEQNVMLEADKIVFPGQGAIGQCMTQLRDQGLDDTIKSLINSKPFLGICLGLQSLMDSSEEDGGTQGLSIIPGVVKRFIPDGKNKIPHMGWNQIQQTQNHELWKGIDDMSRFYFVHSFYVQPTDNSNTSGMTSYINNFTAAIAKDNIFATQFHPEKSQKSGLQLLANFIAWSI